MSCERNPNKFNGTAGIKAGINQVQGKFNSITGRLVSGLAGGVGRSATSALRVMESFDGPSLNSLGAIPVVLEAGSLLASLRTRSRPQKLPPAPPAIQELVKNEPQELPAWAARYAQGQAGASNPGEPEQPQSRARSAAADQAARLAGRRAAMAVGLLKLGQAAGNFAGTGLARLSRAGEPGITAGMEQQFFFPGTTQRPVRLWQSRLTPLLNRADAGVSRLQRSDGVMVESQGQTWHRGTTVVKTEQGERTMTHLQSMTAPSTHYYFNRRLSDNETVGIITGQKGFEPKSLEGYAGQVGEVESLFPAWAQAKKGLIQAHLRWGERGKRAGEQRSGGAGEQSHREASRGSGAQAVGEQGDKGVREQGREVIHPLDGVKSQVMLGGKEYPAMVRRVVDGPGGRVLADATYYDEGAGAWKAVADEDTRAQLAEQVQAGQIEPWDKTEEAQQ